MATKLIVSASPHALWGQAVLLSCGEADAIKERAYLNRCVASQHTNHVS